MLGSWEILGQELRINSQFQESEPFGQNRDCFCLSHKFCILSCNLGVS